ncbi:unnamed protein product [Orchesella dallaii]|uniref:Aminopeptidase n=1 Tax=Orchesella dallaii TaxID=48710 RepID=A0ABP1QFC9_9HEXA
MGIHFAPKLKLVAAALLLISAETNGGPPLQGEIPIGLFETKEDLALTFKETELSKTYQEESYRLPLSVQPIHYDLEIRPILDSTGTDQFTAPGKVAIHVKCFVATNSIALHSKEIEIQHDQVTVVGINPAGNVDVTGHSVDEDRSFYVIHLGSNLEADGEYILTIPFTSLVATNRLSGLYLSTYQAEDGSTKNLATTQFQKDDAQRAFPCFDEPSTAFRATFNVTIGRKADGFHSLANTERIGDPEPIPGLTGWVWDKHAITVNMPVYLIAIIVSDFESETAPEELYRVPVRTWAAPPLMTDTSAKFSAQAAARMLSFFEEYYDFEYQLNKMDSVAIPDFAAGAMENWGLNTYRINLMVWFEEENTLFEKWRSAAVVAHELVHQWFGNLVTCEWWNDTWLNEGFARYFQFIGANYSGGDFRSLDRYVIDVTQLAMAYDESVNTEPVHSSITHRVVDQASRVVYEKAAGLLRMMQSFLTEETLIKGLRNYLKRHQFKGVHQDDLFTALTEQAQEDGTFTEFSVKEIMDTWTLQSGFPLVQVSRADDRTLYISQERYRPDSSQNASSELWYVPISFVTASNPDFSFSNSRPKAWIDKDTILQTLTLDSTNEWVIINPDARGFYRVIYDDQLTRLIQEQLLKDHNVISFGSRSQLLDDYFRSASAKYVNIQYALNLTRYLSQEDDFIVWTTVVNNLAPLYTRLTDTTAYEAFRTYILNLVVEPLRRIGANQLPTDSTPIAVLRTQLLDWVCSLSHEICSQTANELFSGWLSSPPPVDNVPVPTDIQPMIYCGAVAASTDPANTTIQNFLLEEYGRNRGTRQQSLIVNALACDQVDANLQNLMQKAIDDNPSNELDISTHGLQLLQSIAKNSAGRQLLWNFVVNSQSDIAAVHGEMAVPNIISTLAGYLSTKSETDLPQQVETFISNYLSQPDLPQNVINSLQASLSTISSNNVWMDYYYNDINTWLSNVIVY